MTLALPVVAIFTAVHFMPSEKRTIHVGDQVCDVVFVKTGESCTSTGGCSPRGYDKAVCPAGE